MSHPDDRELDYTTLFESYERLQQTHSRLLPVMDRISHVRRLLQSSPRPTQSGPHLLVVDGERGRWVTPRDGLVVGRSTRRADLVLADPVISGAHCRFQREGEDWAVLDLDSSNGTWVNQQRVQQRQLCPGDIVCLGSSEIVFIVV